MEKRIIELQAVNLELRRQLSEKEAEKDTKLKEEIEKRKEAELKLVSTVDRSIFKR